MTTESARRRLEIAAGCWDLILSGLWWWHFISERSTFTSGQTWIRSARWLVGSSLRLVVILLPTRAITIPFGNFMWCEVKYYTKFTIMESFSLYQLCRWFWKESSGYCDLLFIYLFFKTTINPTWNNCPPSSPLFPLCSWVICIPPQFQMFCFHSFFHFILFFFTHFHFPNPSLVSSHSFTSLKFTLESPRFGSCSSRWWPTTTTPGVVVAKWSSGTRLKINSFLLFKWV